MASMQEKIKRKNSTDKIVAENNDEFKDGKAVPEYSAVGCTRLAYSQSLNSLLSLLLGNYESMTQVDKMVDMVETLVMILNNQNVVLLQQLWIEYQLTATLALRAKLSVQMLKLMVNIEGLAWNQVRHMQETLKMLTESIESEENIGEEEMHLTLQSYSQRREERNRGMKMLGQNFSRMAKLVVQVNKGQGLGTVPDIDGCLRDCKLAMGELSCEEWDKKLQPVLRLVLDRFQVVVDIVDIVWVELNMKERFCRLYDNVKTIRRNSVEEDSKIHKSKEGVGRTTTTGPDGDDFGKPIEPGQKMKIECDAVINREAKAVRTLTCSDNLGHAQVQKLSEPDHGSDMNISTPGISAENHTMLGEGFRSSVLCDIEGCPPLGSSTPRRRKSLPSNDYADDGATATATECKEDDLIKTKDFLVLMEQVTGLSATHKLKEKLNKLAGDSEHVRWSSVEKILDSEPDVLFE